MTEKQQTPSMPFTGQHPDNISYVLDWLDNNKQMGAELLDAFLHDYSKNGDIMEAIAFANGEWDT